MISEFNVGSAGDVSAVGSGSETTFASRAAGTPPGDTKDMYITPDGEHMYVLGAYQTFTISSYDVSSSGGLTLSDEYDVEAATATGPGAYNFLGLTGFDK